jgi:predicted NAD/FAD-binding protein
LTAQATKYISEMESAAYPELQRRIAIIGGGISGIACAWNLRKHDCIVDIYEANDRLGGHANSVDFTGNGNNVKVDTGFIAMDEETYRK